MNTITLIPLSAPHHATLLQSVYDATPGFWNSYGQPAASQRQAAHDLTAASEMPGRTIMGIIRRLDAADPNAGMEMVGMIDMRLHYPTERTVAVGLMMVAQPYQRQGIGRQAWSLLEAWLAHAGGVSTARATIEQFNTAGLKFFTSLGFHLTGEANRLPVGDQLIRILSMEKVISSE